MSSLQLTRNVVSCATKRLVFTRKNKVQRSHNSNPMKKTKNLSSAAGAATKVSVSVVKSSTKTTQNETATKIKLQKETEANQREGLSYLNESLW
jgi:hypothetical protein